MTDQKKKQKNLVTKQNVLETLKDVGTSTADDFLKQLIGLRQGEQKRSGDIAPGDSFVLSENQKLKAQLNNERLLRQQEESLQHRKMNELKVSLQALISEITKLASSTQNLAENTQTAMIQAPSNPGIYHITFFENMITFLQSFRKKINEASIWLSSSNKRAEKKNYWSMYKKKGSSFLLSPDHYLQRSAG